METYADRAMAIVGVGAVLPDAPDVAAFWDNIQQGRYSISDVPRERWDADLYYDADPSAPDKTYSRIGGWVREYAWEPMKWRMPIPPCVAEAMDISQQWAIGCTRQALEDYGFPKRALDLERTAVILGNAMGGEKHYRTVLRTWFPELAQDLEAGASFASLPEAVRKKILAEYHDRIKQHFPPITEDTMPGELSNCIAGRIASLFNFRGPNFITDAACASAMAGISAAVEGLAAHDFDVAITGGIDRNMSASTFVKFCKIGALSATGSRPYAEGADGFVMGEGAAIFVMKRLADAERDGDKIYAVLRGMGGSSDGKGKGITAPNPVGQRLAMERAWQNAGLSPATATLIEGHGTSTKVGDVVEVESMSAVLGTTGLAPHSVALGSVKSNIGHLKSAAGAAGLLKATLALHHKVLPPSVQFHRPNPGIDFEHSPMYVNTELRPWTVPAGVERRVGVSAFGFGGTNFHAVLEEFVPGKLSGNGRKTVAVSQPVLPKEPAPAITSAATGKAPLRGALLLGADSVSGLAERLRAVENEAKQGRAPAPAAPRKSDLRARERLAIDYDTADELAEKAGKTLKALETNQPAMWKALRTQGVFRGSGAPAKVAFLYTGQGSQYVNMLKELRALEPIVAQTFDEADATMTPLLGKPLTEFIFVDEADSARVAESEEALRQTAITQPAVLAVDMALTRLLAAYGIVPDMTMGHSLGEYAALVAAGALPFSDALEAVSARGREMTRVSMADNGRMAAVIAPMAEIERILKTIDGYVVIANLNSSRQAVIGGASSAVEQAIEVFQKAGYTAIPLPVSHAFHTSIVAPASGPLREVLQRLRLKAPDIPVVANVDGEFYPMGPDARDKMLDILARQVAAPVQFVRGLHTLHEAGARAFVETGPKKALQGFADDVLGESGEVLALFSNNPKLGDLVSFNQALCGLYAAGFGRAQDEEIVMPTTAQEKKEEMSGRYETFGRMVADVLERGWFLYQGEHAAPRTEPVVITGASLGLPGTERIFDDGNVGRILRGEQLIDLVPTPLRQAMLDKHVVRLVKSDNGGPTFETINNLDEVIKLAGRGREFDLEREFGVSSERIAALDRVTQLAIAAGLDALRDAGIPLVMRYKITSKGTRLPDRWMLPDALRDDTGVIFASAFPGCDSFALEMSRYQIDRARREELAMLESLRDRLAETDGQSPLGKDLAVRIHDIRALLAQQPYVFDRRFLFRVLAMGHSQFAELIGARGPNTQINSACASTTQAMALSEDWLRTGRCRRVIIISGDDVTTDNMLEWIGAGFLASGAAATDESVEEAAIPFDRRRHGLLIGMGAAAMVVETAAGARERGVQPICEMLASVTANSAFHGTRLDVEHICAVMESLMTQAEARCGIDRRQIAPRMMFMSHETYTPARGGSASAEIFALRRVFGDLADRIVIANTKGFTGHAMGTGIEDVVAIKALETGTVPPVANFKEVDPELGSLNLSQGGAYPVEYALRLAAGFGSQISMTLVRWNKTADGMHRAADALGYSYRIADPRAWEAWLEKMSGSKSPELEIVKRTLRVKDAGASRMRVDAEATGVAAGKSPAPIAQPAAAPAPAARVAVASAVATAEAPKPPLAKPAFAMVAAAATVVPAPKPAIETARAAAIPASPLPAAPQARAAEKLVAKLDEAAVKERVLSLVAEKTGYPVDMLDLDLDLEADLGIDTVKQAELFAAIREIYGIERDPNLKLRDFPTLALVLKFVHDRAPGAPPATAAPSSAVQAASTPVQEVAVPLPAPADVTAAPQPAATARPSEEDIKQRLLQLVTEKTGYPPDMLDLDLDLEADLGVDTVKQAELFAAIRETYGIARDPNLKLRDFPTLAHVIRFVQERIPGTAPALAPSQPAPVAAKPEVPQPLSAPPQPPRTAEIGEEEVKQRLLQLVTEKTGYPPDMLDLDLDLEADLGVDTVKQAELFAAIRETYGIARDPNLKLRDFPTLAHVIRFVLERRPATSTVVAEPPAQPTPTAEPPAAAAPRPKLLDFTAAERVPRRVPVPVLRPPLAECKLTGVQLQPGMRVVIMPDRGGVADALSQQLKALGVDVLQLTPTAGPNAITEELSTILSSGKVQGMFWLPALDDEGTLADLAAWHNALGLRLKSLYTSMTILYEHIAAPGTFLLSALRLGGQHGYDISGSTAPLGGSVAGFTKSYKRERVDATVKAVDFEPGRKPSEIAGALIDEALRDPGAVEIGYKDGLRWTIGLREEPADDGRPGLTLNKDTVFVVTGAAGSIVSAITADFAAASSGTFYLLDLVPEPDPANPDLARYGTDREGLKRDLFTRIQKRGERATPAMVEKELAALERAQAAHNAIEAVRAAGGIAHYFSVNLTDADAVARIIHQVRQGSGRIDVLLHAAGMERSHLLPGKERREFDLVFDVKSDGWFNLLHAIGDMPLRATVVFSSVAARFGNAGQTDYSSANDLLCKLTSNLRRTRPETRAIAIDWTAWAGLGMATRGSIPQMMQVAGIDMLPTEAGIPLIRRELTRGGTRGEVVIAERLGIMQDEWEPSGGVQAVASDVHAGPMLGSLSAATIYHGARFENRLDPAIQPFLYDHKIDGTPVLPGVMGIEAFAEAAAHLLPGWRIEAVEDVNFLAPFKFYRGDPRTLTLEATVTPSGDRVIADCRLLGRRDLQHQPEPQVTTHFTGRVRLTCATPQRVSALVPAAPSWTVIESADIYRVFFHGPAYRVLERAWLDENRMIGEMFRSLPPNHQPAERPLLMAPRLIELCFQTAGLWELATLGRFGLPLHIDQVSVMRPPELAEGHLFAVVTPNPERGSFDAEVVDVKGHRHVHLVGYRTVAMPVPLDPRLLRPMQAAMEEVCDVLSV